MKLLLDESLPRRLKSSFGAHEVWTVPEMGWQGTQNGELLGLAVADFDVFVTADQNLQLQQNLDGVEIAVIVLAGRTNRLSDIEPVVPRALDAIASVQPGHVVRIAG